MKLKKYSGSPELEAQHIEINKFKAEIEKIKKISAVAGGKADPGIQAMPVVPFAKRSKPTGKYFGRLINGPEESMLPIQEVAARHIGQLELQKAVTDGRLAEHRQSKMDKIFAQADMRQRPSEHSFNTPLTGDEEVAFQEWKKVNAPYDSGLDYDLRGAFKEGILPDPTTKHWPDTFKKPNHPTFSDQSKYAPYGKPGRWEGETFIPANSNQAKQKPTGLNLGILEKLGPGSLGGGF